MASQLPIQLQRLARHMRERQAKMWPAVTAASGVARSLFARYRTTHRTHRTYAANAKDSELMDAWLLCLHGARHTMAAIQRTEPHHDPTTLWATLCVASVAGCTQGRVRHRSDYPGGRHHRMNEPPCYGLCTRPSDGHPHCLLSNYPHAHAATQEFDLY